MRTVHKARIVPDTAPDGMTTKVIKVEDLGVPVAVALGRFDAVDPVDLADLIARAMDELACREEEDDDRNH